MTFNERIALTYLSDKMEATALMVALAVWGQHKSSLPQKGGGLLRGLNKKGLVMRVSDLNAWRLTREGRAMVSKSNDESSSK